METPKKYFEVVVAGQYHALNSVSGTPTLKNYQESFVVPSQEAALSKICKHLLSPRLKQKYPDFIKFRTHEKISMKLHNYTPDASVLQMTIDDMNLTELSDFCILRQLDIDPFVHGAKDIFAIRTMVQKANEDKRQYLKDKLNSKNAPEEKEAEALRKMNLLPPVKAGDIEINPNEHLVHKGATAPTVSIPTPAAEPVLPIMPGSSEPLEDDVPLPPPEVDKDFLPGADQNDDPFAA